MEDLHPTDEDDSKSTSHPPAIKLDEDEYLQTPPDTLRPGRLTPPTPLILKPDPNLTDNEEEHDSFPLDQNTYQTPISSPMSSPFLTPRSTRGGKSPYADSTLTLPLLPVDTTKPTLITVTGPASDTPFDPNEYIPPTNLDSLPIYIRGPPVARPGTSYSWLGRMFDPIDPEIEAAQKEGWVVNPPVTVDAEGVDGEGKGRKGGKRLRRKFFNRELETVGEEQVLERKGSAEDKGGGRKMWDYVRNLVKG
jgi:hypothetical protein